MNVALTLLPTLFSDFPSFKNHFDKKLDKRNFRASFFFWGGDKCSFTIIIVKFMTKKWIIYVNGP